MQVAGRDFAVIAEKVKGGREMEQGAQWGDQIACVPLRKMHTPLWIDMFPVLLHMHSHGSLLSRESLNSIAVPGGIQLSAHTRACTRTTFTSGWSPRLEDAAQKGERIGSALETGGSQGNCVAAATRGRR